MTKEQCIQALDTLCDAVNSCDNCPIGKSEYGSAYCVTHEFKDMDKADLILYAEVVGFKYDGSEDDPAPSKDDPVNHAAHYNDGGIECIDALEASMTPIEYAGFLKGQVFKYIWRYRLKGKPSEDLKKARYYLDRLIQITEREEATV